MQQVQRFVCSVASRVEDATPLPAAATGGVPGSLIRLRLEKRHPFPLPRPAYRRGCAPGFFLSFLVQGVSPRLWMPQEGHTKASSCLPWGVVGRVAYPVEFGGRTGRFRGGV